jgi:excisionase family DNA binding protein
MTIGQAASYLDVNRITIRRWIQSGKLKGEKIGKVTLILKTDIFAIAYQSEIKHDSQ